MNPTTRSRTGLFLSYRESRAPSRYSRSRTNLYNDTEEDDEQQGLISASSHRTIDVDPLPPKWYVYTWQRVLPWG
jgi:syntaxin 16